MLDRLSLLPPTYSPFYDVLKPIYNLPTYLLPKPIYTKIIIFGNNFKNNWVEI
jgi:hypothetical protein